MHTQVRVSSGSPHVWLHVIKAHFVITLFLNHGTRGMLGDLAQDKFGLLNEAGVIERRGRHGNKRLGNRKQNRPGLHQR